MGKGNRKKSLALSDVSSDALTDEHKGPSTSINDAVKTKKRKNSSYNYAMTEKHKKPSNCETAHASSSKSLKKGKGVLRPCSESKANWKKQKIHKDKSEEHDEDEIFVPKNEIKEMKKSIKELSKAVKKLEEILMTKADLLELVSLKEKETSKKEESIGCLECCHSDDFFEPDDNPLAGPDDSADPDPVDHLDDYDPVFFTKLFVPRHCGS